MKGVRFYFDYGNKRDKRRGGDAPNALAALVCNGTWFVDGMPMIEVASALTCEPNAPVCGGAAALLYLAECCKRVSEAEAYRVHPRLKQYLAEGDDNA